MSVCPFVCLSVGLYVCVGNDGQTRPTNQFKAVQIFNQKIYWPLRTNIQVVYVGVRNLTTKRKKFSSYGCPPSARGSFLTFRHTEQYLARSHIAAIPTAEPHRAHPRQTAKSFTNKRMTNLQQLFINIFWYGPTVTDKKSYSALLVLLLLASSGR